MKKLSTARKFKMVTGQDVMRASKQLEKKQKDEEANDLTDLIEFIQPSNGSLRLPTYRGLAVISDDGMPVVGGVYTCALFGQGAVGYGLSAPSIAAGTEVENKPSAGNGGGQQVLHSRVNLAIHPLGFQWVEGTLAGESPTIAELGVAAHWARVVERKASPLAFLKCK